MFNPAFFKALIDVSRPLPRPLMTTSTFDIPISIAFKAAAGCRLSSKWRVFFRAPLNPELPAEAQHNVFPKISVMVTIVLLNVVFTLAIPILTDFFVFVFVLPYFKITYFLRKNKLCRREVLLFVRVRCPRTGKPFRCFLPLTELISIRRLIFKLITRFKSPSS